MTSEQPREPGILTQPAPGSRRASAGAGSSGVTTKPPAGDVPAVEPPAAPPPPGGRAPLSVLDGPTAAPSDDPPFAAWWRRVAATLLDSWLVATVSFLCGGPFDTSWAIRFATPAGMPRPTAAWWVAVGVLLVLQAYTGWTPGKRALGIAVVREVDGRPLGLLRTIGRELSHLVDALTCFVGYLRPVWHARRRTFADSIAGSDVLVTRAVPPHAAVRWLRRRRVPLPSGQVATAVAGALCTLAVLALLPGGTAAGGLDVTCEPDRSIQSSATDVPVLAAVGPTSDGGWTTTTSAVAETWLTSSTPRLLEARAVAQGWVSRQRLGITRKERAGDTAMFWWVYGGPATTLTAVLGPTEPDGSRSVVDDAHAVRLEVDVAHGTATINHGTVRVTARRPGVVGVQFVPSEPLDEIESFGSTATVEPAAGASTACTARG